MIIAVEQGGEAKLHKVYVAEVVPVKPAAGEKEYSPVRLLPVSVPVPLITFPKVNVPPNVPESFAPALPVTFVFIRVAVPSFAAKGKLLTVMVIVAELHC